MCEITFTLKHYVIGPQTKANGNVVEVNNVSSAHVENIAILKNPPTLSRSPYKTRLTKRPHHQPQLPTRSEQVNAAAAFVPHPDSDRDWRGRPWGFPGQPALLPRKTRTPGQGYRFFAGRGTGFHGILLTGQLLADGQFQP